MGVSELTYSRRRTPHSQHVSTQCTSKRCCDGDKRYPEVGAIRKTRGADGGALDLGASPKFSSDGGSPDPRDYQLLSTKQMSTSFC